MLPPPPPGEATTRRRQPGQPRLAKPDQTQSAEHIPDVTDHIAVTAPPPFTKLPSVRERLSGDSGDDRV